MRLYRYTGDCSEHRTPRRHPYTSQQSQCLFQRPSARGTTSRRIFGKQGYSPNGLVSQISRPDPMAVVAEWSRYRIVAGMYPWLPVPLKTRPGIGSNPGESMDVCKCIVPSRHGGTQNSRRAASPLVRLVEGEQRWEASDLPLCCPLK
ncbi:uncharacterized protein TNCV_436301 [Trichonephila clavipes]|nr:uncharacterized protein TNCV_436301 [Trichonephila clavipes]